ncbi:MAG TPA: ParB N-terminal domain-containing protein [Thiohalobacter sp.]|nr:ParB N-terminal domain-containing protein [Thiohalobacter sp.]
MANKEFEPTCTVRLIDIDLIEYRGHAPDSESIPPTFVEIKESIRDRGMDLPLTVTPHPGRRGYVILEAGNTRLRALKELYAETGDERFKTSPCLVMQARQ